MSTVRRIYVEKKPGFHIEAQELEREISHYLGIHSVKEIRILNRYDVENISDETFARACSTVFSEPPVDDLFHDDFPKNAGNRIFSVEFLPGQFDQRADSAVQCIQFINENEQAIIRCAKTYVVIGKVTEEEFDAIQKYCINPVDSRKAAEEKPHTIEAQYPIPDDVKIFEGFTEYNEENLLAFYEELGLAMTFADFKHIQRYFSEEEKRDPSLTEIRVLDTYWSDHCRHTTFQTEITDVKFEEGDYSDVLQKSYEAYQADREFLFLDEKGRFMCLMDLALIAMRRLKVEGKLPDLEESEEINACSIIIPVDVDGVEEEWLLNFKNETHNHPTEIEPFGGAATCLGGAIRDPLSGRTYVYQAMRITGAADPTVSVAETKPGKLPQMKIVRTAAHGYSSYGNQIGLATGYVKEIYHPNYVAKRMEIGAVLGAAKRKHVKRESPVSGDMIILLGGQTGRDGCGGATGSSKAHTIESIDECGAEVQKGNPPTERKIQRLFRNKKVSTLIKKCNDFGAGGVSVAIGELADGLRINLDLVPKKYEGLDGTEIAISESQERMAVVVSPKDVKEFLSYTKEENLEAVVVAQVTKEARLVMTWRGEEIVNLSRAFLDTNGAHQETKITVESPIRAESPFVRHDVYDIKGQWLHTLRDLNVSSQKGLVEMFDSSIGAGSVLMPYGGKTQLTETQAMVAKIPLTQGFTETVSMMSYGYDPYLSSWSPYHGAMYAVLDSVAKIVATGGSLDTIRFTFQEYFRRMNGDPKRWSQPFAALLGAYQAQLDLGLASIGGKDSMSGTFDHIDVPPTLVSFAVNVAKVKDIISPELKSAGNKLVWIRVPRDQNDLPNLKVIHELYTQFTKNVKAGRILSAYALDRFGVIPALTKMALGNHIGVRMEHSIDERDLFSAAWGDLIAEVPCDKVAELTVPYTVIAVTTNTDGFEYKNGVYVSIQEAVDAWMGTLEDVFPTKSNYHAEDTTKHNPDFEYHVNSLDQNSNETSANNLEENTNSVAINLHTQDQIITKKKTKNVFSSIFLGKEEDKKPAVFIPVFPGTNCEVDSTRAFESAGAKVRTRIFKNQNIDDIRQSIQEFKAAIEKSQIIMFPGGFSAGDEPDGSAKFFATAFQQEVLREEVMRLLNERDGLALGICNGFQALMKLGLLPYGEIRGQVEDSPTLTHNTIGRHISKMVYTKVVNNHSPWLLNTQKDDVYVIPASHGEGRFVANEQWIQQLFRNQQVATQYCDVHGNVHMEEPWNINGSMAAVEGITSVDGRIFGKMAHSERRGDGVAINIYGEQDMKLFEAGVTYFK